MTDTPTTEYRGVTLQLMKDAYGDHGDQWFAWGDYPIKGGTMAECIAQIDAWEIAKQVMGGMKLWCLDHDNPQYWRQSDAVFRNNPPAHGYGSAGVHRVYFRNGTDPDRLYPRDRGDVAMVTPEVEAAIDEARKAYAALVEASRQWKAARRAIPRMTADEWAKLPERGGLND